MNSEHVYKAAIGAFAATAGLKGITNTPQPSAPEALANGHDLTTNVIVISQPKSTSSAKVKKRRLKEATSVEVITA
jgi:hypothetical protein